MARSKDLYVLLEGRIILKISKQNLIKFLHDYMRSNYIPDYRNYNMKYIGNIIMDISKEDPVYILEQLGE